MEWTIKVLYTSSACLGGSASCYAIPKIALKNFKLVAAAKTGHSIIVPITQIMRTWSVDDYMGPSEMEEEPENLKSPTETLNSNTLSRDSSSDDFFSETSKSPKSYVWSRGSSSNDLHSLHNFNTNTNTNTNTFTSIKQQYKIRFTVPRTSDTQEILDAYRFFIPELQIAMKVDDSTESLTLLASRKLVLYQSPSRKIGASIPLETLSFDKVKWGQENAGRGHFCAVCKKQIFSQSPSLKLSCGHYSHEECLDKSVQSQLRGKEKVSCNKCHRLLDRVVLEPVTMDAIQKLDLHFKGIESHQNPLYRPDIALLSPPRWYRLRDICEKIGNWRSLNRNFNTHTCINFVNYATINEETGELDKEFEGLVEGE